MAENLNITIVQQDIEWEHPDKNILKLNNLIGEIDNTDLIILPEMFTTGFTMNPKELYEEMNGSSVSWMKQKSRETGAAITGSIIIRENEKIFNRCIWVTPEGEIQTYDKHHLYTMGDEHLHYSAGNEKLIVEYKGWRICPLICYDLRFPVWSRNTENYDLLIYMANWPSARHHVWKNLLISRAIENQSYCVGVNRTGNDGMGLKYLGDSALINSKGIATFLGLEEHSKSFNISYSELHDFRRKFPLLNDKDQFSFK